MKYAPCKPLASPMYGSTVLTAGFTILMACGGTSQGPDAGVPGSDASFDAGYDAGNDATFGDGNPGDAAVCNGIDAGGHCEITLATSQALSVDVAVDSAYVYWTNQGNAHNPGSVSRVPISGGTVTVLATGGQPNGLAINANRIYWADFTNGQIRTAPLTGVPNGGAGAIFASQTPTVAQVAIDANNLYWTQLCIDENYCTEGAVLMQPLNGGGAKTLATVSEPGGIAVNSGYVYFTDFAGGADHEGGVYRVPIGGGATTQLVSGLDSPSAVALDAASVYYGTSSAIYKMPLNGGTPTLVASGLQFPVEIVVDGATLYFTEMYGGRIMSAPSAGGGPTTTLAVGLDHPSGITQDAANVYWVELSETGDVVQLSK